MAPVSQDKRAFFKSGIQHGDFKFIILGSIQGQCAGNETLLH